MKFIMLKNGKMPTIVGILTFVSMIKHQFDSIIDTLIVGILTFICIIYTPIESLKARKIFIYWHFNFNEQLKFLAQLS